MTGGWAGEGHPSSPAHPWVTGQMSASYNLAPIWQHPSPSLRLWIGPSYCYTQSHRCTQTGWRCWTQLGTQLIPSASHEDTPTSPRQHPTPQRQ